MWPYSKRGGTTLNGREEGGQYYILQTCDQERFEARKVVFLWECLIIFATGCSFKCKSVHWIFLDLLYKYDFLRILSLLIKPLNFTQNDLFTTLDKNTNFNISKNLLLYVSISNSLCSRTVLFTIFKRQIRARGTPTPNPWSAFPAHVMGELPCGSQPTAPTCVVWSWHLKDLPE